MVKVNREWFNRVYSPVPVMVPFTPNLSSSWVLVIVSVPDFTAGRLNRVSWFFFFFKNGMKSKSHKTGSECCSGRRHGQRFTDKTEPGGGFCPGAPACSWGSAHFKQTFIFSHIYIYIYKYIYFICYISYSLHSTCTPYTHSPNTPLNTHTPPNTRVLLLTLPSQAPPMFKYTALFNVS